MYNERLIYLFLIFALKCCLNDLKLINLNTCSVDNSDYMRNGDFVPTRLQAQQDAVNLVCHSKTRSNPENNVGLITLAKYDSDVLLILLRT